MNFKKRFSFSSKDSIGEVRDVDQQLCSLYPPSALLEERCLTSADREIAAAMELTSSHATDSSGGNPRLCAAYEKTPETVVEGLPADYFRSDFDPVEPNLLEISSWPEEDLIERFMTKIEEADTDKDVIIGHLTTMIDSNYDELMECMHNVQHIDVDLCKAGMQIGHCRRKIRSACDIIHSGAIRIRELHQKRDQLVGIASTIRSLKALTDVHKAMVRCLNMGELGRAAEFARNVLVCLQTESYDTFAALQSIGSSMPRSVVSLRQKTDKALNRLCCRKFAASDYENIISAYIVLDRIEAELEVSLHDSSASNGEQGFYFDSVSCLSGLSQRINRFQLDDIDGCIHSAVMEYIYASQQKKQRAAAALEDIAGAYSQNLNMGEMVNLADLPLNLLYRRLSADVVAPCVMRCCELLADVVHTHYLITQWHAAPFDERNFDWDFLHRCPLQHSDIDATVAVPAVHQDDGTDRESQLTADSKVPTTPIVSTQLEDDNGDESLATSALLQRVAHQEDAFRDIAMKIEESFSSNFRKRRSSIQEDNPQRDMNQSPKIASHIDSSYAALSAIPDFSDDDAVAYAPAKAALVEIYRSLAQSRSILWDEMLRALVNMLNSVTFTTEVKLEDFLTMAWALNSTMELGEEFCGSDSASLRMCLREKTGEYFHNFHLDAFQVVRELVDNDSWQRVPTSLIDQRAGIVGMLRSSLSREALSTGLAYCDLSASSLLNISSSAAAAAAAAASAAMDVGDSSVNVTNSTSPKRSRAERRQSTATTPLAFLARSKSADDGREDIASAAAVASNPSNVTMLMRFGNEGNPFHFMTHKFDAAIEGNDAGAIEPASVIVNHQPSFSETNTDQNSSEVVRNNVGAAQSDVPTERGGFWGLLLDNDSSTAGSNEISADNAWVVTQASMNGLIKFVGKYMHMMYLLPANAQQIFHHLQQLFDYYLCAVFHGFTPMEEQTKLLSASTKLNAPAPERSKEYEVLANYLNRKLEEVVKYSSTQSALAAFSRYSSAGSEGATSASVDSSDHSNNSNSQHNIGNSPATGTPTAAMPAVTGDCLKLGQLLRMPAMIVVSDVTCYAVNERSLAAESCLFVAKILDELRLKLCKLLKEDEESSVDAVIDDYLLVAEQLRSFLYRAGCPQLINYNTMLQEIVDNGWDSKKLKESSSKWVLKVIDSSEQVWRYLLQSDELTDASSALREQVWVQLCQTCFDLAIEGFSRVRKCSAEGRAAMTMDVLALHEGLNSIHICRPPQGKQYIENYLRSSYLPEDQLLQWVQQNWQLYAYRHIHGLLSQTLSSMMSGKKLKEAIAVIDNLYEVNNNSSPRDGGGNRRRSSFLSSAGLSGSGSGTGDGAGRFTGMLQGTSSLLSSKFRR